MTFNSISHVDIMTDIYFLLNTIIKNIDGRILFENVFADLC